MHQVPVGIVGAGGIGLAYAAWIAERGHPVRVWSPRSRDAEVLRNTPLVATGVLSATHEVAYADSAQALAEGADVIVIAVPLNAHRTVIEALLPHLREGHLVIVSSMGSLSALYLYEAAVQRGLSITVASFGTTALTARRRHAAQVDVMTRRASLSVSCQPPGAVSQALAVCEALFGNTFTAADNALVSTLSNTSAVLHVPLALLNWTRIERAEHWPQYHYLTPQVAAVIESLDAERRAVAKAFGVTLPEVRHKLAQAAQLDGGSLADAAARLHERRGGPPGPVDVQTRYLSEDVPYGLVFAMALGAISGVPMPATAAVVTLAGLVLGRDWMAENDLIAVLRLPAETVDGLLARVRAG